MALTDRSIQVTGSTPSLGGAGYVFTDPVFGSRMTRVTDANWTTDLGSTNNSFRSPSAANRRGWSADNSKFCVVRGDSRVFAVGFNPSTMATTRLGTGVAYLPFNFGLFVWDHADPNIVYGMGLDSKGHVIRKVNGSVSWTSSTTLVDLDTVTAGLPNPSYLGALSQGNGFLMTTYGAASQEYHHYVLHYPLADPGSLKVIDTATRAGMDEVNSKFLVHGAEISKSGRYVVITASASAFVAGVPSLYNFYVWDTTLDTVYPLGPDNVTGGHKVCSWDGIVNTPNNADAAQWTLTDNLSSATVLTKHDIISPLLLPQSNGKADHGSWNNVTVASTEPFISGFYRTLQSHPWRAWDDEVISINPVDGSVTRFCHHRSQYTGDAGLPAGTDYFWYTPRPCNSNDGNYAYFTSHWDKSLGQPAGQIHRQDVFVVEMTDPTPPPPAAHPQRRKSRRFR